MSGLTLRAVCKSFGDVEVIRDACLEVTPGEFVVFVGPSGCGKSTLLRMIAGLEEVSSGEISIGGRVVNDIDAAERGIAMVFQSYALYPHMTVAQNMGFGLRMTGTPKPEIDARVNEAAAILQLGPLLARRPRALSGGQRQRVAIGRAIVRHPQVFLFDEPLSNLDAELRVNMRIEIARLHGELGATMIYVTHDQVEAMTLADKIVALRDGRIEQVGAPLDLYDDPDNLFVAGFIGSPRMNFFDARVDGAEAGRCAVTLDGHDGMRVAVALAGKPPAPGARVTLGVRPEHFSPDGPARMRLTVDVIEHLGSDSFAYARATAGAAAGETMVVKLGESRAMRAGDPLVAGFDPAQAMLFDAEGQRLR